MGNSGNLSARETRKSVHLLKSRVQDYNPLDTRLTWENVVLEGNQQGVFTYKEGVLHGSFPANKDLILIGDDPVNSEIVIGHDTEIWRLKTKTLTDFVELKHFFTVLGRPTTNNSSYCELCKREFSLFYRKVHCKGCGGVVCRNCARHKAQLRTLGYYNYQKVCSSCYLELKTARHSVMYSVLDKHKFMSKTLMRRSAYDILDKQPGEPPNRTSLAIGMFTTTSFIS